MKERIQKFASWSEVHHMALVYGAGAIVLLLLTCWTASILAGFWLNGIFGTKFELNIGVSGIATVATAGATIYGIARAAQAKYLTDSKFNSVENDRPYGKDDVK